MEHDLQLAHDSKHLGQNSAQEEIENEVANTQRHAGILNSTSQSFHPSTKLWVYLGRHTLLLDGYRFLEELAIRRLEVLPADKADLQHVLDLVD